MSWEYMLMFVLIVAGVVALFVLWARGVFQAFRTKQWGILAVFLLIFIAGIYNRFEKSQQREQQMTLEDRCRQAELVWEINSTGGNAGDFLKLFPSPPQCSPDEIDEFNHRVRAYVKSGEKR